MRRWCGRDRGHRREDRDDDDWRQFRARHAAAPYAHVDAAPGHRAGDQPASIAWASVRWSGSRSFAICSVIEPAWSPPSRSASACPTARGPPAARCRRETAGRGSRPRSRRRIALLAQALDQRVARTRHPRALGAQPVRGSRGDARSPRRPALAMAAGEQVRDRSVATASRKLDYPRGASGPGDTGPGTQ